MLKKDREAGRDYTHPSRRSVLYGAGSVIALSTLGLDRLQAQTPAVPVQSPAPAQTDSEWTHYAGNLSSTRYVPFDEINADNFNTLEIAWRLPTKVLTARFEGNLQSTPLLVNGRLFTTIGTNRTAVALDPETGEVLWIHREEEPGRSATRRGSGHGVAYWSDGRAERILYVTPGYRLICLDAKTGALDPAFGENGVVDLRLNDDQDIDILHSELSLHSTPLVARDTVVVGAALSGSANPRAPANDRGYVRGFDVRTGKRKWIFHTIPKKGEFGYDTWKVPEQADNAGNGGAWAEMSADPELGLVYVPVELPTGDEVGIYRQGNALFGESLVALDIETGERRWHYQFVHHGMWDMDISCAPVLCDLNVGGEQIKALAQPSKQSFLYVLDRQTGKPVWPIVERPVPKGDVPGEWYSPTQPFPTKPPAFDHQGVQEKDLIDWTPEIKARALAIASHYKLGPLFTPPTMIKPDGPWATLCLPSFQGGANWPGGSYDPETGIFYIFSKTVIDASGIARNPNYNGKNFEYIQAFFGETPGTVDTLGADIASRRHGASRDAIDAPIEQGLLSIEGLPLNKPPFGRITAIDLHKGDMLWQIAHGETPDHIRNHRLLKGVTIPRTGQAAILAPVVTKALVICGDGGVFTDEQGRKAARLRAYDKATGKELGEVFIPAPQTGAPMSYIHGDRQYIVVSVASSSHGGEIIAFRLPNKTAEAMPVGLGRKLADA